MKVTVLIRPGCHLCDEALQEMREYLANSPAGTPAIKIETLDIDSDDELHKRYLERIPVIRVEGEDISDIFFEPEIFEAALRRHSQAAG